MTNPSGKKIPDRVSFSYKRSSAEGWLFYEKKDGLVVILGDDGYIHQIPKTYTEIIWEGYEIQPFWKRREEKEDGYTNFNS